MPSTSNISDTDTPQASKVSDTSNTSNTSKAVDTVISGTARPDTSTPSTGSNRKKRRLADLLATEPSKRPHSDSASSFTSRGGSADEGVDPVPEDVAAVGSAAADPANTSDQPASQNTELTIRPKPLGDDMAAAESGEDEK